MLLLCHETQGTNTEEVRWTPQPPMIISNWLVILNETYVLKIFLLIYTPCIWWWIYIQSSLLCTLTILPDPLPVLLFPLLLFLFGLASTILSFMYMYIWFYVFVWRIGFLNERECHDLPWVWLILFNMMTSYFIHFAANYINSFSLWLIRTSL